MFEDRERAIEAQYQHHLDNEFRARARRDRRFGLWVAARLGRSLADADAYAQELVMIFAPHRDEALLNKVLADLETAGRSADVLNAKREFTRLTAAALAEVSAEED